MRRAMAAALGGLLLLAAAPAQAQESGEPTRPTAITVGFQTAKVAPDGDFTMLLAITDAPAASDLAVRIYDRVRDGASLLASAGGDPDDLLDTFDPIPLAETAAAEQSGAFTINLYAPGQDRPAGAWAYRLADAGVYPIEVRVRDGDGEVLTSIVTYLVREPDDDDPRATAPLTLITSVHADPAVSHARRIATAPADQALIRRLGPVLEAFAAHPGVPGSFAVTPDNAVQLAGDAERRARSTLAALRTELARPGRELLGSPYVRIDPASLVANGLADEISRQQDLGRQTLGTTLEEPVADTWYLDRRIDDDALQVLRRAGVGRLVAPSATLEQPPAGLATLTERGDGVLAAPVNASFDLGAPTGADPRLAGYQLLGRLAAVASFDLPEDALAVHVDAAAVEPEELEVVLDGLAAPSTYVRPVTTSRLFSAVRPAAGTTRLRPADPDDLGTYPASSDETHALVDSYGSMVPDQPDLVAAFTRPLAVSASADLPLRRRERDLTRIQVEIRGRFAQISAPARDTVTLGARDASFPLVVRSGLDDPAQVVITLESSDRLEFPEDRIDATVDGERTLVPIEVRTRGSGDTPLLVTTRTPDGRVILAETRYTVRSTAVSGVGVVLTIGAGLFLAAWWGRHWHRGRAKARHGRRGRRPGPTPSDGSDGSDGSDDEIFTATDASM